LGYLMGCKSSFQTGDFGEKREGITFLNKRKKGDVGRDGSNFGQGKEKMQFDRRKCCPQKKDKEKPKGLIMHTEEFVSAEGERVALSHRGKGKKRKLTQKGSPMFPLITKKKGRQFTSLPQEKRRKKEDPSTDPNQRKKKGKGKNRVERREGQFAFCRGGGKRK